MMNSILPVKTGDYCEREALFRGFFNHYGKILERFRFLNSIRIFSLADKYGLKEYSTLKDNVK